jgi:hypothetical protein
MTAAVESSAPSTTNRSTGDPNVSSSGGEREVRYEHSHDLAQLLGRLNASLLVSTYQAGKLVLIGSHRQELSLSFHNFDRPMGMAIDRAASTMAVAPGTRSGSCETTATSPHNSIHPGPTRPASSPDRPR